MSGQDSSRRASSDANGPRVFFCVKKETKGGKVYEPSTDSDQSSTQLWV